MKLVQSTRKKKELSNSWHLLKGPLDDSAVVLTSHRANKLLTRINPLIFTFVNIWLKVDLACISLSDEKPERSRFSVWSIYKTWVTFKFIFIGQLFLEVKDPFSTIHRTYLQNVVMIRDTPFLCNCMYNMWCDLGESVGSRTCDIFSFLFDWSAHLKRYILLKTLPESDQWFQS